MPGTYQHRIEVTINTEQLANTHISLPPEFSDVEQAINEDINEIRNKLDESTTKLLPVLAQASQTYQRSSINSYDSIITGDLVNSIDIQSGGNAATIGTSIFYAEYVNDGRPPVTAKNKKCLHFITKNGKEVFARSVGEAKARPYLEDSFNRLDSKIDEIVTDMIDDML